MSRSGIIGALGVGTQPSKGTASTTTMKYLPATSIGIMANQNTQALPPEVGGSYFLKGAYKAGVSSGGDVSVLLRPDGAGVLLYGLSGSDTVTPVSGQTGAYSHAITPFAPSASADLPWLTVYKDNAKLYAEQFLDTKVAGLRIDVVKQSVVSAQASFFGITPSEVAVTSSPSFDNTPVFNACQGSVVLQNEVTGLNISANASKAERITLDWQNDVSQDEFSVGNYVPDDITLLRRVVNISYDLIIREPDIIRAVYRNGGSGAWSPTIYRGHLHLTLSSTQNITGTTQPFQLDMDFPGIDFLMAPVPVAGGQLLRANLSAQVSLGPSGADTFSMTLVNDVASY